MRVRQLLVDSKEAKPIFFKSRQKNEQSSSLGKENPHISIVLKNSCIIIQYKK